MRAGAAYLRRLSTLPSVPEMSQAEFDALAPGVEGVDGKLYPWELAEEQYRRQMVRHDLFCPTAAERLRYEEDRDPWYEVVG